MFSFLVVSDGELVPLRRTVHSILSVCEANNASVSVLIQPAKNFMAIQNALPHKAVTISQSPDTGIYNGMNLLIDRALDEGLKGRWCFLNSGDELVSLPEVGAFSLDSVIYSDVFLGCKEILKSRVFPYFLKMPHHQSMFIPGEFFNKHRYRYPEHFPIAADLHFKMMLWLVGYKYVKNPVPVSRAEDGGVSTRFSLHLISERSREMGGIAREYFGPSYAIFLRALYFLWYAVRVLSQRKT